MQKQTLLSLNITFILPQEVCDEAVKFSRLISGKTDCFFTLDDKNFFPHITLYQIIIPKKNFAALSKKIDEFIKQIKPTEFITTRVAGSVNGSIGVYFQLREELRKIEVLTLKSLNQFREGNTVVDYWAKVYKGADFSEKQKENIEKYGYHLIGELFDPHITITRTRDFSKAAGLAREIDWNIERFVSSSIGLYELGDNGTCIKLLKEFPLGESKLI